MSSLSRGEVEVQAEVEGKLKRQIKGARGLRGPVLRVARTKVTPLCCKTGSLPGGQRVAVEAATPREGGKPAAQSSRYRPLRSVTLGSPYPTTPDPSVTEHSDRHHSHCLAITETPIPAPS